MICSLEDLKDDRNDRQNVFIILGMFIACIIGLIVVNALAYRLFMMLVEADFVLFAILGNVVCFLYPLPAAFLGYNVWKIFCYYAGISFVEMGMAAIVMGYIIIYTPVYSSIQLLLY